MNNDVYEKYVRQVSKEGSLTKAAEKLGISQPALSSGLTAFEKKLGFRVFDRGQTPVVLTPEGQIYLEYINRKDALTSDFRNQIEASLGTRERFVSVGSSVVYSESIVANAVFRLLEKHPEYNVMIITGPLDGLIETIETGKLDCFISTSSEIPQNLEKKEIKQEHLYLCIPRKLAAELHIEEKTDPTEILSSIRDKQFILLEKTQPIRILIESFLSAENIILKSHITVDQVATAVSLSAMGLGCCFASEDALDNAVIRDRLYICSLSGFIPERPIYVVYHKEFYQTRACRDLLKCLTE